MFEIGKLYKYTGLWSTGLYHSPNEIGAFNKVRQDDMFVILEQSNISTHWHFKVLTAKGEVGWITPGMMHIQPVEDVME
jgi:hypothetical protein